MARHYRHHHRRRPTRKRSHRPYDQLQRLVSHQVPVDTVNIWAAIAGALFYFLSLFLD
jgi:hypothetical protein